MRSSSSRILPTKTSERQVRCAVAEADGQPHRGLCEKSPVQGGRRARDCSQSMVASESSRPSQSSMEGRG